MSTWSQIGELLTKVTNNTISTLVEFVRTIFEGDPKTRQQVAFSIAMIALSAKMAKADGIVTFDEMEAFQQIFVIPEGEAQNVDLLFNLAKQDIAGFESYAAQILALCASDEEGSPALEDILDGLFHIAKADGAIHQDEMAFLQTTASIFKLDGSRFESLLARHGVGGEPDPYVVLGLKRGVDMDEARRTWRKLVQENHPDVLTGRGLPPEFIEIANERLKVINRAWTRLQEELQDA
ncbi:MAG: TerB family tellurite resistance protein [Rhizobiaceae bacterium]